MHARMHTLNVHIYSRTENMKTIFKSLILLSLSPSHILYPSPSPLFIFSLFLILSQFDDLYINPGCAYSKISLLQHIPLRQGHLPLGTYVSLYIRERVFRIDASPSHLTE